MYIGNTPDIDAQVLKYEYTATAGQTVFNCSYDNTVDVHINGVLLAAADYTATTGTEITLVVGATLNDEVQINGYKKFFSANHYDKTASDARFLSPTGDGSGLTNLPGGGKVLQVIQNVKTDTFSTTSGTAFVDVTGLSVSITPSSTSSKILVYLSSNFSTIATGWAQAQLTNASNTELAVIHSRAETTMVVQPFTHIYLDSPASTAEQTYKYRLAAETAGAVYVNRMQATDFEVDVSTITVMEIGA